MNTPATIAELFDVFVHAVHEMAEEQLDVDVKLVVGMRREDAFVLVASQDSDEALAILLEELLEHTRARLAEAEKRT